MCGANRAAFDVLNKRDGIEDKGGELRAFKPETTARLQTLLRAATQAGAGKGFGVGAAIALPRPDGRDLVALVTPLRVPFTTVHDRVPVAAVFLANADGEAVAVDEILRAVYGLTPREAELARELATGRSLDKAAARLGRKLSTERSRLKNIFAKTGAERQADLVRLVLRIATQLRRDVVS